MKNFPINPDGPKGPWYKKVRETINIANALKSTEELVELLGEPVKIEGEEFKGPTAFLRSIGSIFKFGDQESDTVYTYVDPYRPRNRYKFGLKKGKICSSWKEVVHESNSANI